jgi:hypothetical protein
MRGRITGVVLGIIAAAGLGASSFAADKEIPIKQLMGENFAQLQIILSSLIVSKYTGLPERISLIHDHASDLARSVPESITKDRDRFLIYAYSLQGHAADLKSIIEALIKIDAASASKGEVEENQLREAAAAHYGGMVTTCVACHNRFRHLLPSL